MKAIAFCGLACCVCSENKGCVGCQDGGCESHGWCKNDNCCKEKGIVYHYVGQLVGDYDKCQTEEEIIEMIKTGKKQADKCETKIQ